MTRIGLAYVSGAVPGFEDFGNLPTDIVKENGLVDGLKASDQLDALIIPGGTLIESNDINMDLNKEIKKMAGDGKPIIGICAGFQLLSNQIDIGRKSPVPIVKDGLGIIDVNFSPLITSDRVKAKVFDNSFLVKNQTEDVDGFHTHTYGKVEGDAKPLFYSQVQRMNYGDVNKEAEYNIFSGACNDDGNVIGTMIHGILDENPILVNNLLEQIDAENIDEIYNKNIEVKKYLQSEVGINNNIKVPQLENKPKKPKYLMIGSNGSDSGKTFIMTGLAGAIRKRGYKVALLKVGPDVRDIIPGLYLTKGKMEDFASIKIGHLGWADIESTIKTLNSSDYDIVLIEGVMSVFTGLLNEKVPFSAAEIAMSSNIPMILASGVNKGGIESAAIDLVSHANMLEKFGVSVEAILLNKVYNENIFDNVVPYIKNNTNVKKVLKLPKLKSADMRGFIPEVEIRYELFTSHAMDLIENNLNIDEIIDMAREVEFEKIYSFEEIKSKVI
ncbi:cobyrinic acid a,c-diamide synthase [Methanobrevibacter sp. YE315]|uniref:nucleotide-binding protein n=1 Tax=Methanobrevibacter sp. YE315 TaxID=1609968 RepID=UPI000764ED37|nr:DJ-1/PfpI family protein [Methanobrevibacter sp. YE315]AMD16569.1 cobyrinic acid a,c-diamide synthase [Methanobrevibacter sp. YE315]